MVTEHRFMKEVASAPWTVSLAADSTPSSTTILYVSASCTSHSRMVSMCFVPTLVGWKRSMSLTSCWPLNHLGFRSGFDTSHSNTAVSNSVTFLSLSGVRNSAGASAKVSWYVVWSIKQCSNNILTDLIQLGRNYIIEINRELIFTVNKTQQSQR